MKMKKISNRYKVLIGLGAVLLATSVNAAQQTPVDGETYQQIFDKFIANDTELYGLDSFDIDSGDISSWDAKEAGLTCTSGQVKKWVGSAWACAADDSGSGTVPVGTDNQMLQFNGSTLEAVDTLGSIGFGLGGDETNLMWDGSDSYKVHLDGIFEPKDATILKDADIGSTVASADGDVNTIEFVYSDVSATETGKNIRIPTGSAWTNAYSWCDGAEAVLVYDVQYSATLGGSFSSAGTIAHDAAAATDTVDISGWTDAAAGSWIHVDISTAGTTATACTLAIQLENN